LTPYGNERRGVPVRNKHSRLAFLILIGVAVLMLSAQHASAQATAPSAILDQYRAARNAWFNTVSTYANRLFAILALIEFAVSGAYLLLEKTDLQGWTASLVRRIMWIGAFYALLLNGRTWIDAIIGSFVDIGRFASGAVTGIAPGDVMARGLEITAALLEGAGKSGLLLNIGTSLALVIAAVLTLLGFIAITIQFVVAMVESYLVVAAGYIFLGFGGSRFTAPYVERYIGLAVSVGVKIMVLYLLIGLGMSLSDGWLASAAAVPAAPQPAMSAFEIMGAGLIFTAVCWQAPKLVSSVMGGFPALTGGDLVATTGTIVGGAVLAASTAGASLASLAAAASGGGAAAGEGAAMGAGAGGAGGGAIGGGSAAAEGPPAPSQPSAPSGGGNSGASAPAAGGNSASESQPAPPSSPSESQPSPPSGFVRRRAPLGDIGRRLGGARVPSDAAPQAPPPTMNIDHHGE
jgi:type IV secretion system protein TrbL